MIRRSVAWNYSESFCFSDSFHSLLCVTSVVVNIRQPYIVLINDPQILAGQKLLLFFFKQSVDLWQQTDCAVTKRERKKTQEYVSVADEYNRSFHQFSMENPCIVFYYWMTLECRKYNSYGIRGRTRGRQEEEGGVVRGVGQEQGHSSEREEWLTVRM